MAARSSALRRPAPAPALRPGEPADIDAILALENAAFATDRLTRSALRRLLRSPSAAVIVATRGDLFAGYAVVLFRSNTGAARLYSLAVAPKASGAGLGSALVAAAEAEAVRRDRLLIRLEVRAGNDGAIRLYRSCGYREFGRHLAYYADGADALRFEKRLTQHIRALDHPPPYFHQTTDFTCGPACVMMALGWADSSFRPEPSLEFRLWREATTIFMASGPGGCGPFGLALTLKQRGLAPEVHVSGPPPYFLDTVKSAERQRVMRVAQEDFYGQAAALGIRTRLTPVSESGLMAAFDAGCVAIVLMSGHHMVSRGAAHWVFAFGRSGRNVLVHDPAAFRDDEGRAVSAETYVVPWSAFERMARLRNGLSAAIVIRKG